MIWIDEIRAKLDEYSKQNHIAVRDLACTLVAAIAHADCLTTIHIGDGAVVAKKSGAASWHTVSVPEAGEYASTTFFVTDHPKPHIRISRTHSVTGIALFTDGIEHFVLNNGDHSPSSAFFDWVCKPLESITNYGRASDASSNLRRFLESQPVLERTDDDRSLIVCLKK